MLFRSWNKIKGGPDNADDKLRNVHEHVFHFVKSDRYFYDTDAIRRKSGRNCSTPLMKSLDVFPMRT